MSQAKILKFFEKNKTRWFTAVQVSKKIKIGKTSVNCNFNRLRRFNLILHKQVKKPKTTAVVWKYKYKGYEK